MKSGIGLVLLAVGVFAPPVDAGSEYCRAQLTLGDAAMTGYRPNVAEAARHYADADRECGSIAHGAALRAEILERQWRVAFAEDRLDDAERYAREAVALDDSLSEELAAPDAARLMIRLWTRLGAVRELRGDESEALTIMHRMADRARRVFGEDSSEYARQLLPLAAARADHGERGEALSILTEALRRATAACRSGDCSAVAGIELTIEDFHKGRYRRKQ